ncbi:MAG: hypothetical protein LBG45_09670 [Dysgonamonadaceae bacterium]|jgi:hypothetical protein|nr:hypothetical protein [Dysgonamonadaceae bacterium]
MIDVNKFVLKRRIKKILKKSKREKEYLNLKEIKSVLLFFDTKDYSDASYFIKQLKKMGKQVKIYAYQDKRDRNNYSKTVHNVVTEENMNIWKSDSLKALVNSLGSGNPYDLAIDLTPDENVLLQYLLVSADARLKAGFCKTNLPVYDMVISFASEEELNEIITARALSRQLIHYLTTISSNTRTS